MAGIPEHKKDAQPLTTPAPCIIFVRMKEFRNIPVDRLALQLAGRTDIDVAHVLRQVEGWQRLRTKVPAWAAIDELEYPRRISLEQCSGEPAARYKADVVRRLMQTLPEGPHRMADLTGGLGVDFSFIAPLFDHATYVERQEELCALARHNFPLLGLPDAEIVCGDGVDHLRAMEPVDLLFLDPARRDSAGRKTVLIEECEPDVCALRDLLLQKAAFVVLKLSPMLDIAGALQALRTVSEVHVVSVGGECKDLLLVLTASADGTDPLIVAREGETVFSFRPSVEGAASPAFADVCGTYLYEPGAAVLKAGAFKLAAARFGLKKLHPNSHLYTGDVCVDDFPGRRFRVTRVYSFGKKDLKELKTAVDRANLTVRNFPSSVDALRKKLKLKDGGEIFLFATTFSNGEHVLIQSEKV